MRIFRFILKSGLIQLLTACHVFLFTIIAVRLLSPSEYGDMRYVMSLLPLLMIGTLPTYDGIILRNTSKKIVVSLYTIASVRFIGGVGVSILTLLFLGYFDISDTILFFLLCSIFLLPFFDTTSGFRNYLIGIRLKDSSLFLYGRNKLFSLLILFLLSMLIFVFGINAKWLFPSYLLSMIIPSVVLFLIIAHKQRKIIKKKKLQPKLDLQSAIATTLAAGIGVLSFTLDKLLIHSNLGAEHLALYAILTMIPLELAKLVDSLFPLFYRKVIVNSYVLSAKYKYILFTCILLLLIVYSASSYMLFPIIFDDFYSFDFVTLLASSLLIVSGAYEYYCIHKLYAHDNNKLFVLYSTVSVILSYILISLSLTQNNLFYVLMSIVLRQFLQPFLCLQYISKIRSCSES